MGKKAEKKKKQYQRDIRDAVKEGKVNDVDGVMRPHRGDGIHARMVSDMRAGYRV